MSTDSLCFEQKYEKYQGFYLKIFEFLEVKSSIYLYRLVFVMARLFGINSTVRTSPIIYHIYFYTPPHNRGGVLWFHVGRPCVCPSVCPSVSRPSIRSSFPDDNLSKHQ